MASQERPKKLVVIVMKKQSGNSKQINIKNSYSGGKTKFCFYGNVLGDNEGRKTQETYDML